MRAIPRDVQFEPVRDFIVHVDFLRLGKDARVRRALDLAIDRDGLNRTVFNGEYVPGNQWINPTNYYCSRESNYSTSIYKACSSCYKSFKWCCYSGFHFSWHQWILTYL